MVVTTKAGKDPEQDRKKLEAIEAKKLLFYPYDATAAARQAIIDGKREDLQGWPCQFGGLDTYLAPLAPTWLRLVTAQSGNYKTSWFASDILANARAGVLKKNSYVIYITLEESVEEIIMPFLGAFSGDLVRNLFRGEVKDWDNLNVAAGRVENLNLIVIGDSWIRDTNGYGVLTVSNIWRMLKHIARGDSGLGNVNILNTYVDYLQVLSLDPEIREAVQRGRQTRAEIVKENAWTFKDIAKDVRIGITLGSQAREKLEAPKAMFMPGFFEDHESTDPVRRADQKLALWMPKSNHNPGEALTHGTMSYTVTENLLFVKVHKQRRKWPAGQTFGYWLGFANMAVDQAILNKVVTTEMKL